MKTCSKCSETKSLNEFPRDSGRPDGRHSICRSCRKKQRADYYSNNRELEIDRAANWNAEHPDVMREHRQVAAANRKARDLGVPGVLTTAEWQQCKHQFGYCCVDCGLHESDLNGNINGQQTCLTIDHVIPFTNSDCRNGISNIVPRCLQCNSSKGAKLIEPDLA